MLCSRGYVIGTVTRGIRPSSRSNVRWVIRLTARWRKHGVHMRVSGFRAWGLGHTYGRRRGCWRGCCCPLEAAWPSAAVALASELSARPWCSAAVALAHGAVHCTRMQHHFLTLNNSEAAACELASLGRLHAQIELPRRTQLMHMHATQSPLCQLHKAEDLWVTRSMI